MLQAGISRRMRSALTATVSATVVTAVAVVASLAPVGAAGAAGATSAVPEPTAPIAGSVPPLVAGGRVSPVAPTGIRGGQAAHVHRHPQAAPSSPLSTSSWPVSRTRSPPTIDTSLHRVNSPTDSARAE